MYDYSYNADIIDLAASMEMTSYVNLLRSLWWMKEWIKHLLKNILIIKMLIIFLQQNQNFIFFEGNKGMYKIIPVNLKIDTTFTLNIKSATINTLSMILKLILINRLFIKWFNSAGRKL